ncbi:hypothetical protein SAMN02745117_02366 [Lampropedia hyalina DSM 16112]|jgi:hypothetical protein|uniref:Uncharacterized protein n=1 Tax=Lampropedia hyalina DSM 16112 TaxID=1122156 RepID=A0A1M5DDD5_9BURK|nr:hypothetical protein [Lampropedia hyalina]SHF64854.1 hypothetical protein SAMN02745117_02366 [Lampropedia hyalina DSM 16112]
MTYKKTVVTFLDILGTKDNQDFESKYKVHRAFHESMRDCQARDREEASYYRKVYSFSDCAYIFHGLRENNDYQTNEEERLIQVALFNTTLTTIRLLSEGYLVRGGISFGDAYLDDLSFFGPAVEEAFILESKKAVTPRILLSDSLGKCAKLFADKAHLECYSEANPIFNSLPKRSYIPELIQQQNNAYLLNPFYILEMEHRMQMGSHEFTHDELKSSVASTIEAQLHQYPWENPVRSKLEWMREYVANSRCSLEHPDSSFAMTRES